MFGAVVDFGFCSEVAGLLVTFGFTMSIDLVLAAELLDDLSGDFLADLTSAILGESLVLSLLLEVLLFEILLELALDFVLSLLAVLVSEAGLLFVVDLLEAGLVVGI